MCKLWLFGFIPHAKIFGNVNIKWTKFVWEKMITDVTIDPGCEVAVVTAARVNCNILKYNVMISTVIFKNINCRYGRITCSLKDSCGLKKCRFTLLGAPEHVNSTHHKAKLASPIFILMGCWNDWSWIGNTNLSPILCLGHYVAAYSRATTLLARLRKNSIIITIENCLLQLTPFSRATFKVK